MRSRRMFVRREKKPTAWVVNSDAGWRADGAPLIVAAGGGLVQVSLVEAQSTGATLLPNTATVLRVKGSITCAYFATAMQTPLTSALTMHYALRMGIAVTSAAGGTIQSPSPMAGDDADRPWMWFKSVILGPKVLATNVAGIGGPPVLALGTDWNQIVDVDIRVKRKLKPNDVLSLFLLGTTNSAESECEVTPMLRTLIQKVA